nr:MAG TPA: hypothetical protein [Caudoviricetes sp.]
MCFYWTRKARYNVNSSALRQRTGSNETLV